MVPGMKSVIWMSPPAVASVQGARLTASVDSADKYDRITIADLTAYYAVVALQMYANDVKQVRGLQAPIVG